MLHVSSTTAGDTQGYLSQSYLSLKKWMSSCLPSNWPLQGNVHCIEFTEPGQSWLGWVSLLAHLHSAADRGLF